MKKPTDLPPVQLVIVSKADVDAEEDSGIVYGRESDDTDFDCSAKLKKEDRPFYKVADRLYNWDEWAAHVRNAHAILRTNRITPLRAAHYLALNLQTTSFAYFLTSRDGYEILRNLL